MEKLSLMRGIVSCVDSLCIRAGDDADCFNFCVTCGPTCRLQSDINEDGLSFRTTADTDGIQCCCVATANITSKKQQDELCSNILRHRERQRPDKGVEPFKHPIHIPRNSICRFCQTDRERCIFSRKSSSRPEFTSDVQTVTRFEHKCSSFGLLKGICTSVHFLR